MTGALNRRAFADVLSRALSEERRHHNGLALGICDIDEFKKVNDVHGHQVGDEVLCGLVRLVTSNLRGHDVLSRHGGDEFVVLAAHTGNADLGLLYERARAAVADHPIHTQAGDLSITISFGVSMWREGETEDELLAAADAALYRAKGAGRNRVEVAEHGQIESVVRSAGPRPPILSPGRPSRRVRRTKTHRPPPPPQPRWCEHEGIEPILWWGGEEENNRVPQLGLRVWVGGRGFVPT